MVNIFIMYEYKGNNSSYNNIKVIQLLLQNATAIIKVTPKNHVKAFINCDFSTNYIYIDI